MNSCITDTENKLDIQNQLCFALYSTSRAITKEYAVLLDTMGVTYPQYLALMVLWKRDGLLVQEMAASLEIDQATATPMLQRLEKLELITRQRSQQDERRVLIFLTSKGKALYKIAQTIPAGLGCAIGVDQTQAKRLIAELNVIKNFMKNNKEQIK